MQPDSSHEQLQIYTNWANYYLRKTGHDPAVRDLQADLKDGVLLSRIIEAVFESKIVGITLEPSNQAQELDNLSSCLDFIRGRGVSLDDVISADVHTGSLDAIFSLFYALSVHRQKIKATTAVQQTSTPVAAKESQPTDQTAPPSVPPKSKKIQNGDNESVSQTVDYVRSFGYKESVRKSSFEDSESAPVSRGGSLDRKSLREDRFVGRSMDSFNEEPQSWRRHGLGGALTPQYEVRKSSSWLSVKEAARLSDTRRVSKNLSVRELVAFLEKGEVPPESNESKKLPAIPPKPRPGRLETEQVLSFQPISAPESGSVEMRHSSRTDVSSQPSNQNNAMFSSPFLSADPVSHDYSLPGTPPPTRNSYSTMDYSTAVARPTLSSAHRHFNQMDGPPLPPRNPSMRAGTYPMHRGESFLSEDRFTTVSLLTEHEPIPEPGESVQTVTLGPTHVTSSLVNSDRLPSPKMPLTVSLSPQTGTTGSDLSSPDQTKSFQASPLVRGVLERSQEGIDRLERSGKGSGLVGWATKSFRRMSTPKSANRKKLPIPHSPTSPHFSPHGLKRASSEWNNKAPKNKMNSSLLQEEKVDGSPLHRSVSLSESLNRRPKLLELGPSSSEYRPALPVRRPPGEKPLSQEIQELLEGFDISLAPRSRQLDRDSPSNLYANLGEDMKSERQRQAPDSSEIVTTPNPVVTERTSYPERDPVFKKLLFAQDQLARKEEELRELRDRIDLLEQTPFPDPLTPVFSGIQTEGQSSEKKKRNKRRWLLGRGKVQKGEPADSVLSTDTSNFLREIDRLRQENSFLREDNARLRRGSDGRTRDTPAEVMSDSLTSSSPSSGQTLQISLFVLTRDHHDMTQERLIGAGKLELTPGEISWERLDREVVSGFMSHLRCLDSHQLGLEEDTLSAYLLGSVRRQVGARQIGSDGPLELLRETTRPEILVDLRAVSLANLSYQLLIPLRILQQYTEILFRQRRILVLGPPGTGKTHLAESLGQFVSLISAPRANRSSYKLFPVGQMSFHSIMQSISMTLKLEGAQGKIFVFDGIERAQDLDELCSLFFSEKTDPPLPDSPYILATLRSDQTAGLKPVLLQHGLWVVSYLWNREPVLGLLGRLLRQKLLHLQLTSPRRSPPSQLAMQMVEWLPATLETVNSFIESTYSPAAVLGPGLFLSCPLARSPTQIEQWFSRTWNEYIFPYLQETTGNSSRDKQQEIVKQVLKTCPIKFSPEHNIKQPQQIVESEL